jgi:hypothetical protein
MTVVVTVKINDGIVLAADSAVSFFDANGNPIKIYSHANKVFNLVKGLPIGVMFWGVGGIGSASVATIAKDLRKRLAGEDSGRLDWKLPDSYTMEFVAKRFREYFFEERFASEYKSGAAPKGYFLGCKICGYSTDAGLPEVWDVKIVGDQCAAPELTQTTDWFGPRWDGEYEALDRLILGTGTNTKDFLMKEGLNEQDAQAAIGKMIGALNVPVVMAAMPIQDAIDLATFMVETTIKFVRFNFRAETVGGPIEIAAITKHEGFKWIRRKFFFTEGMNP